MLLLVSKWFLREKGFPTLNTFDSNCNICNYIEVKPTAFSKITFARRSSYSAMANTAVFGNWNCCCLPSHDLDLISALSTL